MQVLQFVTVIVASTGIRQLWFAYLVHCDKALTTQLKLSQCTEVGTSCHIIALRVTFTYEL